MRDHITAQERLAGLNSNEMITDKDGNTWDLSDIYPCDKCEEPICPNDEAFETRYGFICTRCAGH